MTLLEVFDVGRSGGMATDVTCFGGQSDSDSHTDIDSTRNNRAVTDSSRRPNNRDMGQGD